MRADKDTMRTGLRRLFEIGQRAGGTVLLKHFYSPTPDIRALRAVTFYDPQGNEGGLRKSNECYFRSATCLRVTGAPTA
jgi:hypothetical protein